jgi:hypothetical protein
MAADKSRGKKWDGKSRVSNDLYRKRWKDIFKKVTDDNAEKFIHNQDKEEQANVQSDNVEMEKLKEEQNYLEELKKKL